ncbi:SARP family transcriptional regulator [Virgisporangium aliadipatigenens]|uniref:SARP family transcriptional regulator n=1 Tax=Virgisporangium aliadipatigenens TaxID=741659 RepID=A0A8J3YLC5_9ACTN|nr:BTAD domain-containing putative transcriptional regulator [Virgisporangium aliadipatigenens]GIJ46233.1 SARP family transcriptional regulator [Virgisporangium aliadipatigenens]
MRGNDRLRVTLLDAFRVTRGEVVLTVPGARLRGLLVRLALAGGHAVEPAVLIGAIWAEEPPSAPAAALQNLVSRLRRALDPAGAARDTVAQDAAGYRLAVQPSDVDAVRFERCAAAGRERLRAGDPEAARAALAEAVALWGEHPGAEPALVAAVAPAVATRLARVSFETVADLADAELALGLAEAAAGRLGVLLGAEPGHERAAALLMDAFAAQGRQAEALAVYERVRERLADTLGADPGTALRERHLRLLRGAATAAPVGEHRPRSAGSPENLPAPVTSFVGRDDDLDRVGVLLASGRLVTVLGPGGAGKTRLALEAARRYGRDYPDGARLIDLAAVAEPTKIAAAVHAGIGPRAGRLLDARPHGPDDELDGLAGELRGREILLLLDNCEHLIHGVAHLASALLSRCPRLRVIATSREPLAVDGEALVPLAPLALPDPDDTVERARAAAAVRLFTERATAVRPGFAVDGSTLADVVRVVRGLDGLPLALELAAARLRTLALPDLADGLSDRFRLLNAGNRTAPPRHRTLRAVIAWSWELLDAHERTVAERISVLPGGVTRASAAAVCAGTGVPAEEIPNLLAALVDRSLLQLGPGAGRYRMLETIREYGTERLRAAGDLDPVRDLAAAYFAGLVAEHDPLLRGPGQRAAVRVVAAEYDNTLAALRHRCATHDATGAIALTLALTWYWQMSGRHADAVHWLGEALAVPGGGPTPERDCARAALLLHRADVLSGITAGEAERDRAQMRELADRLIAHPDLPGHHRVIGPILLFLRDEQDPLENFRRLADGDDGWTAGLAHLFLAEIAENTGALDRMLGHVETALERFGRSGDDWARAAVLSMRARVRRYDDLDGALADLDEARALAGEFGALSLGDEFHGDLLRLDLRLRRGDLDRATEVLATARERARRASSTEMRVLVAAWEATLRLRLGEPDRARALLDDAERDALRTDHARAVVDSARVALRLALGDPPGAQRALRAAYGSAAATRELPILAPVAVHAAALADTLGRPDESAALLGVAARLRGAHDRTDPQVRELTRRGRAALGEEGFAASYARGREADGETARARLRAVLFAP